VKPHEPLLSFFRVGEDRMTATSLDPNVRQTSQSDRVTNVAELARDMMALHRDRAAFVIPNEGQTQRVTFGELGRLVDRFGVGLETLNLPTGARVMLLAPPTPQIFAFVVALLRAGHTLVTVDGRGDARRMRHALQEAAADIVIGSTRAIRWWPLVKALRRARRFSADASVFGTRRLDDLLGGFDSSATRLPVVNGGAEAVIAFSSGNTGLAKRIVRSHSVLLAQHHALLDAFPLPESDVNLPGFPLAVLHNLCRGTTTVLPTADLRSMAAADVDVVLRTIREQGVTSISGAPAFVGRLATQLLERGELMQDVQRIVVGGGPVSRRLAVAILAAFPLADARVVYGATEAEPIATAPLNEILDADPRHEGFLAGWPVSDIEIRLDGIENVGELLVRGPHVIPPAAPDGWHRTGDICRLDERGRLWLLGRVGTEVCRGDVVIHPFTVEARAARIPGLAASAFVAHTNAPDGELVVQLAPGASEYVVLTSARALVDDLAVRVIDEIPMDARHQSKVDRSALISRLESLA
jgi:acyl-CoA synthetase (AMP-forming)/AMP-acid ligase II